MKKYKDLFIALISFLLYFSFSILANYVYSLFKIKVHNIGTVKLNILLILSDLILLVILFIIHRKAIINDFKKYIDNKGKWFIKYLLIFIGSILLMGVANVILSKVTNMETSENEELVRKYIKLVPAYMGFSTIIFAPFMEELLFRKCIRNIVKGNDKIIKITYIIISSVVFGLMHVITLDASFNDILMGIPYMIAGLSFAYIYAKTDNIFATMQFHIMHNTILFILQLIVK